MAEPIAGARAATPLEVNEWENFKRYYTDVLAKTVLKSKTVAEIANQAQAVVDAQKVPGFIYDAKSLANTTNLLNRFNMIGRYIAGVESGKYAIRLKNGDIDIMASPQMAAADYEADIYPTMGIAPIIWVLGVGVVLVAGVLGVASILKFDAQRQQETNEGRLIDASKEMAKQPGPVKKAWNDFLAKIRPSAQEVGVLEKLLGTEATGKIGAGIGFAVLLIAGAFALKQWRRS